MAVDVVFEWNTNKWVVYKITEFGEMCRVFSSYSQKAAWQYANDLEKTFENSVAVA